MSLCPFCAAPIERQEACACELNGKTSICVCKGCGKLSVLGLLGEIRAPLVGEVPNERQLWLLEVLLQRAEPDGRVGKTIDHLTFMVEVILKLALTGLATELTRLDAMHLLTIAADKREPVLTQAARDLIARVKEAR